ncbi:MAG: sorbosone dehydrogenase family protein [Pyrinomonadaceae bacterium]|nr:sorbosone dehydrogenase family protein [Blastocatellia bacterium]MCW5957771.1 sorbosone dehydrogenase family protein [Pyrinomonadaceae bacterium]
MSLEYTKELFAAALMVIGVTVTAVCQTPSPTPVTDPPKLPEIVQTDKPTVFSYDPAKLPPPFHTVSARRNSRVIPQPANAKLTVPKGFKVNVFAEGEFRYPRWMALAPNGDVFVADSRANSIIVLRDKNKDGVADERFVWSDKLAQPFGMAFHRDWFYVANTDSVVRFAYKSGQTQASAEPERLVELTAGGYNQHWTRNILFSPDGKKMFVSIGSATNVDVEADPKRAAISVYDPDGKNHRIYASGLRNPIGLAWNPKTGELWTAVNERDGLGDDLVPDYATSVKEGGFYGWPFSYIGQNEDPRRKGENPELLKKAIVPDVLFTSHVAALGIQFYSGKMFPKEYQGDAFVAFHGSWNRAKLSGYRVVRIKFDDKGKLEGNSYEDFVSGWLPDENSNEVWGRPVGLLVLPDGSLLITDDGARKIWRVSYGK